MTDPRAELRTGYALVQQGKLAEARPHLEIGIEALPSDPMIWTMLGQARLACGELHGTIEAFESALALAPDHPTLPAALGELLVQAGRPADAQEVLAKGADDQPGVRYARAMACRSLGNAQGAKAELDAALDLQPNWGAALRQLGVVLVDLGAPEKAAEVLEKAAAVEPEVPSAHLNLGAALQRDGRHADAVAAFDTGLAAFPDNLELRLSRGLARLFTGDYPGGFADIADRPRPEDAQTGVPDAPRWDGTPLNGPQNGTLFLRCEQGYGDTLMLLRYLPWVRERVGSVVLEIRAPLVPLIETQGWPERVVTYGPGAPLPSCAAWASLLDLPRLAGTTVETAPPPVPYKPEMGRVGTWAAQLGKKTKPRVGLAWAGNPAQSNDAQRSIGLLKLAPLLDRADIDWVDLQVADRGQVPPELAARMQPAAARARDFADTAACLTQLDALVTIDSAPAHLAASMGVPTVVLLPHTGQWQWATTGGAQPFYPEAALLRQTAAGDWAGVVARVGAGLDALLP